MSHTRTQTSTWAKPSYRHPASQSGSFRVAFRLGPYQLANTELDVSIVDLGEAAVSGEEVDLSNLRHQELFLKSVPDRQSFEALSQEGDVLIYPFYSYDRCWVATQGDVDAYMASFSKTSRKGLRRRVNQLKSLSGGELDIRNFRDAGAMGAYFTDARAVSAKTFQERLMDDGLPEGGDFLRQIEQDAHNGGCYGSILYLNDEPVSYLHCERQGTGWLAVYGGFDPAHAKQSPGTVHLLSLLENAFDDPASAFFDFGPGHSDYKHFFATHAVPASDVLVLKKTMRNRAIVDTHRALRCVTDWSVSLADRLQFKTLLRQKIRGR